MKRLLFLIFFSLLAINSHAQTCFGPTRPVIAKAHETITVSTVSIGFTAATLLDTNNIKAVFAVCTTETNPLRYWEDGATTAPTATVGHLVAAGATIPVCQTNVLSNIRFIRSGAADATMYCTYYWGN